jgi:hypothetical protein
MDHLGVPFIGSERPVSRLVFVLSMRHVAPDEPLPASVFVRLQIPGFG